MDKQSFVKKHLANGISLLRIVGVVPLLCLKPLSLPFFLIYGFCVISDFLDGIIARRTHTESELGATLDSIADFLFICSMLSVFLPLVELEQWMLVWIAFVFAVRLVSLFVGFIRYHTWPFLHTYSNKTAGFLLFLFPFYFVLTGMVPAFVFLSVAATLSAVEELVIIMVSKKLNRNIGSVFSVR